MLGEDLARPRLEAYFLELGAVLTEVMTAYKKVGKWAAPEGVPFNVTTWAMFGKVHKHPKGTVLIIGPFNYPFVRYYFSNFIYLHINSLTLVVYTDAPCEHEYSFGLAEPNSSILRLGRLLPVVPSC